VGDGRSTKIWLDHLLGDGTLANKLPDLFMLASDPNIIVDKQVVGIEEYIYESSR